VFDVEGVLIPKIRFILFEVAGHLGVWSFIKAAFFGFLYEVGLISLKEALKRLYRLFKGLPVERFLQFFQEVPLMPNVENVMKELKRDGFQVALITFSIPRVALEKMAEKMKADFVSGLEVGVSEGRLTGEIWGDVIEREGKAGVLKKILDDKDSSRCRCICVADDRNNLSMFKICNLRIGYNPDFILGSKSDYVVKGDLSEIMPIIRGDYSENRGQNLSRNTIIRETIHVGGFSIPLICLYLVDRYTIALLISLVMILYTVSEIRRMFGARTPIFSELTSWAARKSEYPEFVTSPIFYALGIILSLVVFPVPISYVAIAVLTLGDGFASILGRKFGTRYIPFNKSKRLEGTLFGFLFAVSGSLLFVTPIKALVASAVGMFF
jgi:phosphoserine phosphatase/dolichol kinase